jgi:hypothetical protein
MFGVIELDAELASLVPTAFVAVIVKVYAWLNTKVPVTEIDPSKSVFVYVRDNDGLLIIPIVVIPEPFEAPSVYAIVTSVALTLVTELIVGAFGFAAFPRTPFKDELAIV